MAVKCILLLPSCLPATPTDHFSWRWRLTEGEEDRNKSCFQMLRAQCRCVLPGTHSSSHACPTPPNAPGLSFHILSSRQYLWLGPLPPRACSGHDTFFCNASLVSLPLYSELLRYPQGLVQYLAQKRGSMFAENM